jgi:hypothetical protein
MGVIFVFAPLGGIIRGVISSMVIASRRSLRSDFAVFPAG